MPLVSCPFCHRAFKLANDLFQHARSRHFRGSADMMSFKQRCNRRGAMTESEFISLMAGMGFVEQTPRSGVLHEFTHPDMPEHNFWVGMRGATYSQALDKFSAALADKRATMQPHETDAYKRGMP